MGASGVDISSPWLSGLQTILPRNGQTFTGPDVLRCHFSKYTPVYERNEMVFVSISFTITMEPRPIIKSGLLSCTFGVPPGSIVSVATTPHFRVATVWPKAEVCATPSCLSASVRETIRTGTSGRYDRPPGHGL